MKEVWKTLEKTDPKYTKGIEGKGFKGTAINPTYCYKKMTEVFGPVGIGWKFETVKSEVVEAPEGQLLLYKEIKLYVRTEDKKGWSDPIEGCGGDFIIKKNKNGLVADDEAHKKVTTDALTNAMKFLGMSADVHMGLYDDNKYINQVTDEFKKDEPKETSREDKIFQRDFLYSLGNTQNEIEINSLIEEMGDRFDALPEYINGAITDAIEAKRKQFKSGVKSVPLKFGFLDVQEAGEFGVEAKTKIEAEKNLDDLREWMADNDHKLKALDVMLSAKKYQTEEGSPYQRLKNAYNKRLPAAAE